jgi:hypothetical protein
MFPNLLFSQRIHGWWCHVHLFVSLAAGAEFYLQLPQLPQINSCAKDKPYTKHSAASLTQTDSGNTSMIEEAGKKTI